MIAVTSVTSVPQGTLPLASLFVEGVSGCVVLVAPDILQWLVTTPGIAESQLLIPNTPALVAVTFYHQMLPIEIDAGSTSSRSRRRTDARALADGG